MKFHQGFIGLVTATWPLALASAVTSSGQLLSEATVPAVEHAFSGAETHPHDWKNRLISQRQASQNPCQQELELSNQCLGGPRGQCQGTVRAYIYGRHPVSLAHTFIGPDAQSFVPGPGETPQERIAIPIPQGQSVTIRTPLCLISGRIYFAPNDGKLSFAGDLLDAKGLVMPSEASTVDKSRYVNWSFMEFTINEAEGLTFNPTSVDFAGLPLALRLGRSDGTDAPIDVLGMKADGVATVCDKLIQQAKVDGQPWDELCVQSQDGKSVVRALSPKTFISTNATAFQNYYQPYVDQVWGIYTGQDLTLTLADGKGNLTCRVHADQIMHCGATPFPKPSAQDIFSCDSGPFHATTNPYVDQIIAVLCAGFQRSTLHIGNIHPSTQVGPSQYYQLGITNHYARLVHEATQGGKGYAFPVDWVSPPSTDVKDMPHGQFTVQNSGKLTVIAGGWR